MKAGKLGILLALMCAALIAVPATAGAATTTGSSLTSAPVTGVAHNGKKFSGHYTVTDFVTRGGKTYAVGTLTGRLGQRSVRKTVDMPVSVARSGGGILGANKVASPAATCPVLHLNLGPLNLNLLGLKVQPQRGDPQHRRPVRPRVAARQPAVRGGESAQHIGAAHRADHGAAEHRSVAARLVGPAGPLDRSLP